MIGNVFVVLVGGSTDAEEFGEDGGVDGTDDVRVAGGKECVDGSVNMYVGINGVR